METLKQNHQEYTEHIAIVVHLIPQTNTSVIPSMYTQIRKQGLDGLV